MIIDRKIRIEDAGFHHIINRGVNRGIVFNTDQNTFGKDDLTQDMFLLISICIHRLQSHQRKKHKINFDDKILPIIRNFYYHFLQLFLKKLLKSSE